MAETGRKQRKVFSGSGNCWMVFCTASGGCGDYRFAGESTFKVFWRRKDTDADGTGGM